MDDQDHRFQLDFMKRLFTIAMLQSLAAGLLRLGTGCETVEKYSLPYRLWDEDLNRRSPE